LVEQRFEDLVCVVGEANAWPYRAGVDSPPEELVHWVAHRVATGEMFDMIAAPERPLSPSTTFHSELTEQDLRDGGSRTELLAEFARFVRPSDVVCAWGHYGPGLLVASGGALPPARLDLRFEARRMANRKLGSLETYAETIGPVPRPLTIGRAGKRLAMIVEIVRDWHGRGSAAAAG
jgi:hypothetical protein